MSRRVVLWVAFVVVHVAVGVLGYHQPSAPMGDVYLVYEPWSRCALFGGVDPSTCTLSGSWQLPGVTEKWIYPQLALIPMAIAWAFAWAVSYTPAWAITVSLANAGAFALLVGAGRSRGRVTAAWFWLAAIFLIGPVGIYRIDGFTVPLAIAGGLWLVRRPFVASVLLSVAVWMKVWPAAILAAGLVAVRRRLALVWGAAVVSVGTVLLVVVLGGANYVFGFVGDQTSRGIQMEAPVAGVYMIMAALNVPDAWVYYDPDVLTFQVTGPQVDPLIVLMTPLLLLAIVGAAALGALKVWRGASFATLFPPLSLVLVTAFIVLNKVGSPQYYVWIFAPIVVGLVLDRRRWAGPAVLTLAIAGVTQLVYPLWYDGLMATRPFLGPVLLLELRNALAAALLVWAVVRLFRVPVGRTAVPSSLREWVTGERSAPLSAAAASSGGSGATRSGRE